MNDNITARFLDNCKAQGLSEARIKKYGYQFPRIKRVLPDLANATKSDVENALIKIFKSELSESSKRDFQIHIRKFFRWLGKPELVEWIKLKEVKVLLTQDDIIDELKKSEASNLIECSENERDKALTAFLWATGARSGELINTKIKDVEFSELDGEPCFRVVLNGKTGLRNIPVFDCLEIIKKWVDSHPYKNNPEAPLFYIEYGVFRPITYATLLKCVKRASRNAQINRNITPKHFRRGRATHLIRKGWNKFKLCKYMGWYPFGNTVKHYALLMPEDLDQELINRHNPIINTAQKVSSQNILEQALIIKELFSQPEFKEMIFNSALKNPQQTESPS